MLSMVVVYLDHDVILFFQHFESGQQLQDGIIKTAASGWNHQDSNIRSAAQDGSIRTAASGQQDRLVPWRRHCRIAVLGWQHLDGTVRTKESGWHHQDDIIMMAPSGEHHQNASISVIQQYWFNLGMKTYHGDEMVALACLVMIFWLLLLWSLGVLHHFCSLLVFIWRKIYYIDFLFLQVYWNWLSACGLLLCFCCVLWYYVVCDSVRTAW